MGNKDRRNIFYRSRTVLVIIIFITIFISFFRGLDLGVIKFFNAIDGFIFFLLGLHILYFVDYWVEDSVKMMEDYLNDKSDWYKKGMAVKKNPVFNKIFFITVGVLCILWFLLGLI